MNESNLKSSDRRVAVQSTDTSNKLLYLMIGGGIGAAVALLFAPKQGSELRGDIAKATREGYDLTKEKAGVLKEQSTEVVQNLRDKAAAAYDFAASKVTTAGDKASDTVSVAGQKVSEAADRNAKEFEGPSDRGGSSQIF